MPDLTLDGLTDEDAQSLLAAAIPGHLDEQVRDRIVAETRGNPLALLELARGTSTAELAGGFAVPHDGHPVRAPPGPLPAAGTGSPEPTQQLMLLAAADPTGDATLSWRAAPHPGPRTDAAAPAESSSCSRSALGSGSAIPSCGRPRTRPGHRRTARAAHLALAEATDGRERAGTPGVAPGRRRHRTGRRRRRAARTDSGTGPGPRRARRRRRRSSNGRVALTADPGRRAERALAAAHAHLQAGAFDAALGLLAEAEAAAVDDLQRARVEQLEDRSTWLELRARGAGPTAAGRRPARVTRSPTRPGHLPSRLVRAHRRRSAGTDPAAGSSRSPGRHDPSPPPEPAPRPCDLLLDGHDDDDHRRARRGRAQSAAGRARIPRRSGLHRRLGPVGPSRYRGGRRALGLRQLGRDEHPPCRTRPRLGRVRPAVRRAERPSGHRHLLRRLRDRGIAGPWRRTRSRK